MTNKSVIWIKYMEAIQGSVRGVLPIEWITTNYQFRGKCVKSDIVKVYMISRIHDIKDTRF